MCAQPASRGPRYEDLFDIPDHHVGEIVLGTLYASPRPAVPHAVAASELGGELGQKFGRGRGGPGGWVLLFEPELHFNDNILVPDVAAWRRERMPELPRSAFITTAPDWVCEVLSPSTSKLDRGPKREVYAREHVPFVWFVDPDARTLEVLQLDGLTYRVIATYSDHAVVRADPFAATEIELRYLWGEGG